MLDFLWLKYLCLLHKYNRRCFIDWNDYHVQDRHVLITRGRIPAGNENTIFLVSAIVQHEAPWVKWSCHKWVRFPELFEVSRR